MVFITAVGIVKMDMRYMSMAVIEDQVNLFSDLTDALLPNLLGVA